MDKRVCYFNDYFSHWKIELSDVSIRDLNQGKIVQIVQAGWTIKVLFDDDAQGKYMDFYAAHRMTNDRHVCVHIDGSVQNLPALLEGRICSDDVQEDERLEQKFKAANRKIMKLLNEKGFRINGQEHPSFLIQKFQLGVMSIDDTEFPKEENG